MWRIFTAVNVAEEWLFRSLVTDLRGDKCYITSGPVEEQLDKARK